MATVNEQIVTGRKFRKLIDEATKLWQRISFWTKASDVEFDDGSTAETKMGAINGITDSLVSTSSNIAASAKALNQLNNKLAGLPEWIQDSSGKITGYKTPGGADTVFPFSSFEKAKILTTASSNFVFTFPEEVSRFLIIDYTSSYNQHYSHTFYWDEILGNDRVCMDNFTTLNVFMNKSGNTFTIRCADDHTWQCKVIYWPK